MVERTMTWVVVSHVPLLTARLWLNWPQTLHSSSEPKPPNWAGNGPIWQHWRDAGGLTLLWVLGGKNSQIFPKINLLKHLYKEWSRTCTCTVVVTIQIPIYQSNECIVQPYPWGVLLVKYLSKPVWIWPHLESDFTQTNNKYQTFHTMNLKQTKAGVCPRLLFSFVHKTKTNAKKENTHTTQLEEKKCVRLTSFQL